MVVTIVLICGIPGAGKSYFAKRLIEHLRLEKYSITCSYLNFDEYLPTHDNWDESTFYLSRVNCFAKLNSIICDDSPKQCIIVDDNMYLHSMRRQIYIISRKHRMNRFVLWVNTDIAVALERNIQRDETSKVDERTIIKMHSQFEKPSNKHIADRYSLTIDGSSFKR